MEANPMNDVDTKTDVLETDVLVAGAGPCGLGAAWRYEELLRRRFPGLQDWLLVESALQVGGNAASFTDEQGFTWDCGSHVIYSHYPYFDRFLQETLADEIEYQRRQGWVWLEGHYIPFPLQNNLQRLPRGQLLACLKSLPREAVNHELHTFRHWLDAHFGSALCELFFYPFNRKMWAHDPGLMATGWTARKSGSRHRNVPLASLEQLLENIVLERDAPGWEQACPFPYPRQGGAGRLWSKAVEALPARRVRLGTALVSLDAPRHEALLSDGTRVHYRRLISSLPLPELIPKLDAASRCLFPPSPLKYSSSHVVGLGLCGPLPALLQGKCWIYVADPAIPFFRLTVLSSYSRFNVPQDGEYWSVLCEVSSSDSAPLPESGLQQAVEDGLSAMGLLDDGAAIVSRWQRHIKYGYPIPCLERDVYLDVADALLTQMDIYSRGRFGAWKYEVSNQDNAFMQGVEAVDSFVLGTEELTYRHPDLACRNAVNRVLPA